jgi:hypothetical protein
MLPEPVIVPQKYRSPIQLLKELVLPEPVLDTESNGPLTEP